MKNKFISTIIALMIGISSTFAVSNTFESAYIMGIIIFIVLLLTSLILNLIKTILPSEITSYVSILILVTIITNLILIIDRIIPNITKNFSIYIPVIAINSIILKTVIDKDNKAKDNILKVIKYGVSYLSLISIMGVIRELFGMGSITIINNLSNIFNTKIVFKIIPSTKIMPISLFNSIEGAYITLGLMIALMNLIFKERVKNNESI